MPELNEILLLVHAASTWFIVGLIWFVQIVHYPLMIEVPEGCSVRYAELHQRRTGLVVGPLMLTEAVTAVLLAVGVAGGGLMGTLAWAGLGLLVVVWLSTFAVQVPLHRRLAAGFDPGACRRLVATNALRTAAWTARGVVAAWMLAAPGATVS